MVVRIQLEQLLDNEQHARCARHSYVYSKYIKRGECSKTRDI
jgi:hypothetical protein